MVLDEQGGSVLQLTIGDKGAYLYGVFGAPIAHEDDGARACEAALQLLEIANEVPVTDLQIGVATGRLRSGTYGHAERRTFCCLGDSVNLAARLMGRAGAGEIWVQGDVALQAGARFAWADLPDTVVKGREQPVRVRSLVGRTGGSGQPAPASGPRTGWSAARRELALPARALDVGARRRRAPRRRAGRGRHRQEPAGAGAHRPAERRRRAGGHGRGGPRPPGDLRRVARRVERPARSRSRLVPGRRHRRRGRTRRASWSPVRRCSGRCWAWPCPTAT